MIVVRAKSFKELPLVAHSRRAGGDEGGESGVGGRRDAWAVQEVRRASTELERGRGISFAIRFAC